MKTVQVIVWIGLAFIGGLGWGLWLSDKIAKPDAVQTSASVASQAQVAPAPNRPTAAGYTPLAPNINPRALLQEYAATRQKILENDPSIASEFKELQGEIDAQREKLNAAMIKVDPKVAAIIAKLDAMRHQAQNPANPSLSHLPAPSSTEGK